MFFFDYNPSAAWRDPQFEVYFLFLRSVPLSLCRTLQAGFRNILKHFQFSLSVKTEILARHKMAVAYHLNLYDLLTGVRVVEIRDRFSGSLSSIWGAVSWWEWDENDGFSSLQPPSMFLIKLFQGLPRLRILNFKFGPIKTN